MYLGWSFLILWVGRKSVGGNRGFREWNRPAIRSATESDAIAKLGEKLSCELDPGEGAGNEQFVAQHNRAALASGVFSPLLAFLQHFAIWLFSAWIGVPASAPPTRAKTTRTVVSHLAIQNSLYLTNKRTVKQSIPAGKLSIPSCR